MVLNRTTPSLSFLVNSFISVSEQSSHQAPVTSAASNSITGDFLFLSFLTGPSSTYMIDHKFSFFVIQCFHHSVSKQLSVWSCMTHTFLTVFIYCCCSNQPSMALSESVGSPRVTVVFSLFLMLPLFLKDRRQAKTNLFASYPLCWPSTAYSPVVLLCFGTPEFSQIETFCVGFQAVILCQL